MQQKKQVGPILHLRSHLNTRPPPLSPRSLSYVNIDLWTTRHEGGECGDEDGEKEQHGEAGHYSEAGTGEGACVTACDDITYVICVSSIANSLGILSASACMK